MNKLILTGKTRAHLSPWREGPMLIHPEIAPALEALTREARAAGFDLQLCSSFRDYECQLKIWNGKAGGSRPIHDDHGKILDWARLSPGERLLAILRWSAVPGASRHHWGTDLDVFDAASLPEGYRLRLTPEEYAAGGILGRFSAWLDDRIGDFGFFRPYAEDRGGVHPEPWHLSYAPIAEPMSRDYTLAIFEETVRAADMELKDELLASLDEIYSRYVMNIRAP